MRSKVAVNEWRRTSDFFFHLPTASAENTKQSKRRMARTWIEVCLISARGLQRRSSSFWKLQWFAVGWIIPEDKYCTKIDASGNGNPIWKTKFSTAVDSVETGFQDLVLHVEVYKRDPVFLRESLLGTASVALKEFLQKHVSESEEISKPVEESGSFQVRRRNSNKCAGFVDISIRVSEERNEPHLLHSSGGINLATPRGQSHLAATTPQPTTHVSRTEIPRPMRRIDNMASPVAPQPRGHVPGFEMGLGVGALEAGAAIFGDYFLPGFRFPGDVTSASTHALSTHHPSL